MRPIGEASLAQFFGVRDDVPAVVGTVWRAVAPPLEANEQAMATCRTLTAVLRSVALQGQVFVTAIEMDADAGRFPGLLDTFFGDPYWDYDTRFYVREMRQTSKSDTPLYGLLSAEGDAEFVERMLQFGDGIRWAANLSVEGIQIPDGLVADVLDRWPLDRATIEAFGAHVRLAFKLSHDLVVLHVYCARGLDLSVATEP